MYPLPAADRVQYGYRKGGGPFFLYTSSYVSTPTSISPVSRYHMLYTKRRVGSCERHGMAPSTGSAEQLTTRPQYGSILRLG